MPQGWQRKPPPPLLTLLSLWDIMLSCCGLLSFSPYRPHRARRPWHCCCSPSPQTHTLQIPEKNTPWSKTPLFASNPASFEQLHNTCCIKHDEKVLKRVWKRQLGPSWWNTVSAEKKVVFICFWLLGNLQEKNLISLWKSSHSWSVWEECWILSISSKRLTRMRVAIWAIDKRQKIYMIPPSEYVCMDVKVCVGLPFW